MINPPQPTIDLLMLLQEQESDDRVRPQSNEARDPTSEHPSYAFGPIYVGQQPRQPFTLLGAHHARLDDVDGAADRRRDEPSQE